MTNSCPCGGEASNGGRLQMLPAGTKLDGANGTYRPLGALRLSSGSQNFSGALALRALVAKLTGQGDPGASPSSSRVLCRERQHQAVRDWKLARNAGGLQCIQTNIDLQSRLVCLDLFSGYPGSWRPRRAARHAGGIIPTGQTADRSAPLPLPLPQGRGSGCPRVNILAGWSEWPPANHDTPDFTACAPRPAPHPHSTRRPPPRRGKERRSRTGSPFRRRSAPARSCAARGS